MELHRALRLGSGMVVAFTGAGGKTGALQRLLIELSPKRKTLITTSTRIGLGQLQEGVRHVVLEEGSDFHVIEAMLRSGGDEPILVTTDLVPGEAKWGGLSESTIKRLRELAQDGEGLLLVEADGARGRSAKAPAEHEPVIPAFTDLVVPVLGLDALGRRVDGEHFHRPERLRDLLGMEAGEEFTPKAASVLLSSERGGLKGVPEGAEVRILLNKAEAEEQVEGGRQIAGYLRGNQRVSAVLLGSVQREPPVLEVQGKIPGIILAAGGSERLGRAKQLIRWRGESLIRRTIHTAQLGGLDPVLVVLGAHREAIQEEIANLPVQILENPGWEEGLSASLRIGLEQVEEHAEAVVFLQSDMPLLPPDLIQELVGLHRSTLSPIILPRSEGHRGNPALFDRSTFEDLKLVQGDQGGRELFDRYPLRWVEWDPSVLVDVDTQEDLDHLKRLE